MRPEYYTMVKLREDAIRRGMDYLAIMYGWSAIRMGEEWTKERFLTR